MPYQQKIQPSIAVFLISAADDAYSSGLLSYTTSTCATSSTNFVIYHRMVLSGLIDFSRSTLYWERSFDHSCLDSMWFVGLSNCKHKHDMYGCLAERLRRKTRNLLGNSRVYLSNGIFLGRIWCICWSLQIQGRKVIPRPQPFIEDKQNSNTHEGHRETWW